MQERPSSNFPHIRPPFPEHEHLKCPRCDSMNTKFCYYNNYNLSQPRHFCKNCRRYWTKGGTLRNVPVGGGTRKNVKRPSDKKNSSSSSFGNETPTLGFGPLMPSHFLEAEEELNIVGGGGGRNNSGDKLNLLGVELGDVDFSGSWADLANDNANGNAIYTSAGATYR